MDFGEFVKTHSRKMTEIFCTSFSRNNNMIIAHSHYYGLNTSSHLIFPTALWVRDQCCHFIDVDSAS